MKKDTADTIGIALQKETRLRLSKFSPGTVWQRAIRETSTICTIWVPALTKGVHYAVSREVLSSVLSALQTSMPVIREVLATDV